LIRAVLLFLAAASAAFDREEDAPNLVAASLAKGEFSAPTPHFLSRFESFSRSEF
jgi:hypothetical protein